MRAFEQNKLTCSTKEFHIKNCVNHHRHHHHHHHHDKKIHPKSQSITLNNINNQHYHHHSHQNQVEKQEVRKIPKQSKSSIKINKMSPPKKRLYDNAFERRNLNCIENGDFHIRHSLYKVLKQSVTSNKGQFLVQSEQNSRFHYGKEIIREQSTSATYYENEEKITKTEMIKLFNNLSIHDIWFAVYLKQDTTNDWQKELVTKIQGMSKDDAIKYVKKDFTNFGKLTRELAGKKILPTSDNNYYTVRDLKIYFEELDEGCDVEVAAKKSIRKIDVNTLQSLIFNSVKYVLK